MSDGPRVRKRLAAVLLQGHFLLTPAYVPEWRADVRTPPAAVLTVGDPVRPVR